MAKSPIINPAYSSTGDDRVDRGREPMQLGWYELAATYCANRTVLDVGCGMGDGLNVLAKTARTASGIDLDERLERSSTKRMDISEVPAKSVDVVTCIDVIEHVEEDLAFMAQLARVAREEILISTPNFVVSRCRWRYHVREYMPHELLAILEPYGAVEMYKGSGDGFLRYRVRFLKVHSAWNRLRVSPVSGLPVRIVNHVLPVAFRIQSSLFARVRLHTVEIQ